MCDINWEIIVNLLGILVNAILAVYIVKSIQKGVENERSIKDHFFDEIKDLRSDYKSFLNAAYTGKLTNTEIVARLKLLGIKSSDLMNHLHFTCSVDKNYLSQYHIDLNKIITEDSIFIQFFNQPTQRITFTPVTLDKILKFQHKYQNRFNVLILTVNGAKYKRII